METKRSIESKESLIRRIADHAAMLRRKDKLNINAAVGKAVDYFGISENDRETISDQVKSELGRRGADVVGKKRKEARGAQEDAARLHWAEEARRAGFDDVGKYLESLKE